MTNESTPARPGASLLGAAVVVAALGYFVDIYDLVLFSILWKPSLQALGVPDAELLGTFYRLLNVQQVGFLVGGIGFGILGDRKGRLHILFGSITLYSLATLANGFVHEVSWYAACRFLSGLGLAGELGAGVTLVAELLPTRKRGYGTMIVAAVGVSGAVFANLLAQRFDWRIAYFTGGGLGLALLLLRVGVAESGLFKGLEGRAGVARGNFLALFSSRDRFGRFARSCLIGLPIWFSQAMLVSGASKLAEALGNRSPIVNGNAVAAFYLGLVFGDLGSGTLSQVWGTRRKVVLVFQLALAGAVGAYFALGGEASPSAFYGLCLVLGVCSGYWAILVTVGAEQFGTNLRATVATSVPNFVRAMVIPMTAAHTALIPLIGLARGAMVVGAGALVIALWAASGLRETFGKDLDFIEE